MGNRPGIGESKIVVDETAAEALAFESAEDQPRGRSEPVDDELVRQSRRGDMTAFSLLVQRYQDRIFNTTYRLCGNYQDACELTQEAFLRALRGISGFRGESKFYTWLFRIAVNLTRSHRRRAAKRRFKSLDDCQGSLEVASQAAGLLGGDGQDPAEVALKAEQHGQVMEAMGELAQQYRTAIVLRDVQGLDYQQIAEILAVPVGTVKSRVHRARLALRENLADLVK